MCAMWVCTFCKLVLHSFRCFEKKTQKLKKKIKKENQIWAILNMCRYDTKDIY